VKAQFPNIKIMCLSMYADTISINEMKDAGADGYIFKNTGKQQLIDALDCIALNGTYFSEALNNDINPQNEDVTNEKLTSREIEVLKLIEKEYNNKQISNELFISQRTVETHRKNIFRKTNTQNVIGLLKYAYNHHII
ncbi:MAG: DNA-binding response regulator, partial [Sphingobacteriales bacterium]